ncbi:MAG: hypothetical protein ACTHVE_08975 [Senegalia sp. (in: firmicutes)]|uniref:hypothetical protein n=1 Tax=Senegalia sp. (in: firmicutes) TaxID=1924098 RepID=UPI003F9796D2
MKKNVRTFILINVFILFITSITYANDISEEYNLYNIAMEEKDLSTQTKLFIEGYINNPTNEKFISFMINNLDRVMNWSEQQYNLQKYKQAILGYSSIVSLAQNDTKLQIDIEELNTLIIKAKEKMDQDNEKIMDKEASQVKNEENKVDESQNNLLPKEKHVEDVDSDIPTLEEILELGAKEYKASAKRKIYMEGYELYPESKELKNELTNTANSLFFLGNKYHKAEDTLNIAISYYDDILEMPSLSNQLIVKVEKYKKLANEGILYRTVEEIIELGNKEDIAVGKRKIYIEGYKLYPNNEIIKKELANTGVLLLQLGINKYELGDFKLAINYFNDILSMPEVSKQTIEDVKKYKNLATKEIKFRTVEEILELGSKEYTASGKREIYIEGYELYPGNAQIKEKLEYVSNAILQLGRNNHYKGKFNHAISYYNKAIETPEVQQKTAILAKKYKDIANKNTM